MTLITEQYKDLNRQLHETREDYGQTARKYASQVAQLAKTMEADSILDYGCGKGILAKALSKILPPIAEYDPGIPGKDKLPEPADLLVSIDVLEHIEPDCLDDVLQHMRGLAKRAAFLTVATRPAAKTLADGRNAHLIVQPIDWWMPKLIALWSPRLLHVSTGEFAFLGVMKETTE